MISKQATCFAQKTSANITIPILFSICSIKKSSEFTIIEVSCPQPNRCIERSELISPNLAIITNLNQSHMNTHGSIENLIKHKFESLSGLTKDGTCVINEDTDLFKEFVELSKKQKQDINFNTYSAQNKNANAFLIEALFEDLSWKVKAQIGDEIVEYKINKIQGHWPLTSVGLLLEIKLLGLDVKKASLDMENFTIGWDSMGKISKMSIDNGFFLFYDQHFSITEKALKSALEDVKRIKVKGKKIVVLSGELNSSDYAIDVHKRIAKYINDTDIDMLYTVGEHMDVMLDELDNYNCFKGHFFNTKQLKNTLLGSIEKDSLVFIKGMTKLNFKLLSDSIYNKFIEVDI